MPLNKEIKPKKNKNNLTYLLIAVHWEICPSIGVLNTLTVFSAEE